MKITQKLADPPQIPIRIDLVVGTARCRACAVSVGPVLQGLEARPPVLAWSVTSRQRICFYHLPLGDAC